MNLPAPNSKTALFASCVAGAVFPGDAQAQRRLLALSGFPDTAMLPAFCCGQPASTAGDAVGSAEMGRSFADQASEYDAVFVASATCCGHLRHCGGSGLQVHYAPDVWLEKVRVRSSAPSMKIYLHRPCHDVWDDDRYAAYARWVAKTANVEVIDKPFRDACCGFGGVFSTLFDRTAESMMAHRIGAIAGTGTGVVVSAEPGCLSHFAAHAGGLTVVPLASFLVSRGIA